MNRLSDQAQSVGPLVVRLRSLLTRRFGLGAERYVLPDPYTADDSGRDSRDTPPEASASGCAEGDLSSGTDQLSCPKGVHIRNVGEARCSAVRAPVSSVSVWSPSAESRAQLKREHRWQRRRTTAVWLVGLAVALVYWAVISTLIRWDQLGEVLGLLTVVPIGMIVGNAVGNHMDHAHATHAAKTSSGAL